MVESQNKRAFGLFSTRQQAESALNELKDSGFPMDKVSIIAKQAEEGEKIGGASMSDRVGTQDVGKTTGVVTDIATTGTLGTVLIGLGSIAIPNIGFIIAAGSLGATLASTIAGFGIEAAAINNLVRGLSDLGIPEEKARIYSDRLLGGDYFVIVDGTNDEISRAESTLSAKGIQNWATYNSSHA